MKFRPERLPKASGTLLYTVFLCKINILLDKAGCSLVVFVMVVSVAFLRVEFFRTLGKVDALNSVLILI